MTECTPTVPVPQPQEREPSPVAAVRCRHLLRCILLEAKELRVVHGKRELGHCWCTCCVASRAANKAFQWFRAVLGRTTIETPDTVRLLALLDSLIGPSAEPGGVERWRTISHPKSQEWEEPRAVVKLLVLTRCLLEDLQFVECDFHGTDDVWILEAIARRLANELAESVYWTDEGLAELQQRVDEFLAAATVSRVPHAEGGEPCEC